jgi:hypothetical protein
MKLSPRPSTLLGLTDFSQHYTLYFQVFLGPSEPADGKAGS